MKDLLTKNTWLWERAKFMNRRYIMQVGGASCMLDRISSASQITNLADGGGNIGC